MALHEALTYKDWDRADMLITDRIARGDLLNEIFLGQLPLHVAVAKGAPTHLVERLLASYPEGAETAGENGRLPLHDAAASGGNAIAIFDMLLTAFPDSARAVDASGRSAMHFAVSGALETQSSPEIIALLHSHNPDAAMMADEKGCLPLHLAAGDGSLATINCLLEIAPQSISVVDQQQKTPLHWASFKDSAPEVLLQLLAAYPAACLAADTRGQIPLHLVSRARTKNALAKAAALLEACPASVHYHQKDGKDALTLAVGAGSRNARMSEQLRRWICASRTCNSHVVRRRTLKIICARSHLIKLCV